jgi:hypothetical protein
MLGSRLILSRPKTGRGDDLESTDSVAILARLRHSSFSLVAGAGADLANPDPGGVRDVCSVRPRSRRASQVDRLVSSGQHG